MPKKIILINHLSTLTGATVYIYNMCIYLKKRNHDVLMLDDIYNKNIFDRYINKYKLNVKYYNKDLMIINDTISKFIPTVIYVNCPRNFLTYFIKLQDPSKGNYKMIFHSHETYNSFVVKNAIPRFQNYYVVTEAIKNEYNKNKYINVKVGETFICTEELQNINLLFNEENKEIIKNKYRLIDKNKIIIGMSGVFTLNKGYDLFIDKAKKMPNYEFLWIGGECKLNEYPVNFFHVPHVSNPYKFYKLFDLFYFTSREEADPYVIYEMKIFNIPIKYTNDDLSNTVKHNSIKYNEIIRIRPNLDLLKLIES